ncbi:helix-turn-helix transcriptional regulator [Xanthobacter sp. KR7-65]|uniref:AraC family transcriptional regulator n=1 Tax=Xanthobacter sp. KR7-65 TaxID=3156612 RepID=UPI0032B3394A
MMFNTADVPEAERMAFVRDYYGPILTGLELAPVPDNPFGIAASFLQLPGAMVAHGHSGAMVSQRTNALLSDGIDDFCICRPAKAYRVDTPAGRTLEVGAGETGIWTLGQRSATHVQPDTKFRTVQLSRALLRSLVPNVDDINLTRLPAGNPMLDLMFSYADLVAEQPAISSVTGIVLAGQLAQLAALAINGEADKNGAPARTSVRAARLAAAKAATQAALHQPGLSTTAIAARLGISPRYVQILFEEDGETFSSYVTRLRMEWLRRMLEDPLHAHRRISDLAFEAGFRDLSTFNRQFRRYFGKAPSAARRREVP